MHHEIRRAQLSFKTGGWGGGEERKKMKDFRRGSKGFTNHYIIERAQTTDEVRIQKIVERAFKIINWSKICSCHLKKYNLAIQFRKKNIPRNIHICLILQANCQHPKWSFNLIFFLSWCFTFNQCLMRVSAFYKKLLNIKKCYCSMFIKS